MQPDLLPPKPDPITYGYVAREKPTDCSEEALIARCRLRGSSAVTLVWSPESERMVPPAALPFLHGALRERTRRSIHDNLGLALLFLVIYGLPLLLGGGSVRENEWQLLLLLSFAVIPLVEGWWQLRQWRQVTPEILAAEVASARYAFWIWRQRKVVAWFLLAIIAVVFGFQIIGGFEASIKEAGLTRIGLQMRDAYRFLTAGLLHGGVFHFLMNAAALFVLGVGVEALIGGAGLALVFTASALGGSALSFVCTAQTTVGASGGIMGLVGCLAVLGFRFRKILPPRFGHQMVYAVFLTALTGFAAHDVIDNAAHAGGLLTGAALGWILIRRQTTLPLHLPRVVQWAGYLSLALLIAAAALIAGLLFHR
jgi:membrane associated rhomboid family serine protease